MLGLADAHWVDGHQNLVVTGPTGVGKTFVPCALAQAAVRQGHTALYQRVPRLLDDLAIRPLTPAQASDLLEVIEDRAERRATIVTSPLPWKTWHEALGDPTVADAILDRLAHNSRRIGLRGESLRRGEGRSGRTSAKTVDASAPA